MPAGSWCNLWRGRTRNLTGDRDGCCFQKLDNSRQLILGQLLAALFNYFPASNLKAFAWYHSSPNHLASTAVGNSIDVAGRHVWKQLHHPLNFHRIHFHSCNVQHAAHPAGQIKIPGGIEEAEVAGTKKAIVKP